MRLLRFVPYASEGEKFLQCIVTGDETWVNQATREMGASLLNVSFGCMKV
jgi:hypothetical protein